MIRIALSAMLFALLAVGAQADNIVQVSYSHDFQDLIYPHGQPGDEAFSVNFLWDTTNNTILNPTVVAVGPFTQDMSSTPSFTQFNGGNLSVVNFSDARGDLFQLDEFIHDIFTIGSTPGIYRGDLFFDCVGCLSPEFGEADVSISAVSTPEPGTLLLLGVGLLGVFLWRKAA